MLTPTLNKVVAGQTNICGMLEQIRAYHKELGWPKAINSLEEHREECLGLMAECAEVLNAAPWKPWKNYKHGTSSICGQSLIWQDVAKELVDVLFFMSSIMEIWEITPQYFAYAFEEKLAENYNRLNSGCNTRPTKER